MRVTLVFKGQECSLIVEPTGEHDKAALAVLGVTPGARLVGEVELKSDFSGYRDKVEVRPAGACPLERRVRP
jgi:hypothetical protein